MLRSIFAPDCRNYRRAVIVSDVSTALGKTEKQSQETSISRHHEGTIERLLKPYKHHNSLVLMRLREPSIRSSLPRGTSVSGIEFVFF